MRSDSNKDRRRARHRGRARRLEGLKAERKAAVGIIRCGRCGAEYMQFPEACVCTHCGGDVSQLAGVLHVSRDGLEFEGGGYRAGTAVSDAAAARTGRREYFGDSWLGWLNRLILQWCWVRLAQRFEDGEDPAGTWGVLWWVRPRSGYGGAEYTYGRGGRHWLPLLT